MASDADLKMELAISRMLRVGVSLAALVVFVGSCMYVVQAHGVVSDYRHFHASTQPLFVMHHPDSRGIIHLGILLLIATPIMRVAFCVYSFARQRDRVYVVISTIVLAVLLYSFFRP